jgi:hypothetical protein
MFNGETIVILKALVALLCLINVWLAIKNDNVQAGLGWGMATWLAFMDVMEEMVRT